MEYKVGYKEAMMEEQREDERISDQNTLIHHSQGQRQIAILLLHTNPSDLYAAVISDSLFTLIFSVSFAHLWDHMIKTC